MPVVDPGKSQTRPVSVRNGGKLVPEASDNRRTVRIGQSDVRRDRRQLRNEPLPTGSSDVDLCRVTYMISKFSHHGLVGAACCLDIVCERIRGKDKCSPSKLICADRKPAGEFGLP